ncbi:hypothetical protein CSPX01_05287 [Colletotrichum filicis]|nr:hypothetical protein CSPX01_05287 [Colletotrichum filicis]
MDFPLGSSRDAIFIVGVATTGCVAAQRVNKVGLFCELCINDITAPEQRKQRQWPDEAHLKRHQETKFHVGYEAWCRRVKFIKKTHKSTGYECELYASSAPPKAPVHLFATVDELERHISGSDSGGITGIRAAWVTEPAIIEQHDALKQALGWDRPEFRSSAAGEQRNQADRSKKRKSRGWQSENLRELDDGLDVPGNPAIILGGPRRPSFPAINDRKGSVLLYPAQEILPERLADLLSIAFTVPDEHVGVPDAESTVHAHLANHRSSMVTILPPPGTNDNTPSHHLDIISLVNNKSGTSKP